MKKITAFSLSLILLLSAFVNAEAETGDLSIIWLDQGQEVFINTLTSVIDSSEPLELIPFATYEGKVRRCGFVNTAGEVVIAPQYDSVWPFVDGLARVTVKGEDGKAKYGCINTAGEMVIEPQYDSMDAFSDGYALVMRSYSGDTKLYGYVNTRGEEVITPQYGYAESFVDGFAKVGIKSNQTFGIIDKDNNRVIPIRYSSIGIFSEGLFSLSISVDGREKWGFMNTKGEIVIPFQYEGAGNFSEGLAPVAIARKNADPLYGYINTSGEMVIAPQYATARDFVGGYAVVSVFVQNDLYIAHGLIDSNGRFVVPASYSSARSVSNGVALIRASNDSGEYYGWYDTESGTLVGPQYAGMNDFSDGLACVSKTTLFGNRKYGFVLPDGRTAISVKYDAATSFSHGLAVVGKESKGAMKYGCLDSEGEFALPMEYDSIKVVGNLVVVTKDGRSGFAVNPGFGTEHTYTGSQYTPISVSDILLIAGTAAMVAAFAFVTIRDRKRKKATQESN